MRSLFEINSGLDVPALAQRLADHGRVQIRNVLTPESAGELQQVLQRHTPWSIALFGEENGTKGPRSYRYQDIRKPGGAEPVNRMAASAESLSARANMPFAMRTIRSSTPSIKSGSRAGSMNCCLNTSMRPNFWG